MKPRIARFRLVIDRTIGHGCVEHSMTRSEDEPLLPASESAGDSSAGPLYAMTTTRDRVLVAFIFVGLALFLPSTWYLVLANEPAKLGYFAPHPLLQSLGITALLLGIIPLQAPPPSGQSSPASPLRKTRVANHQRWILMAAFPTFAVGVGSMWWNKHIHGAKHFTTWHGLLGAIAVVWMVSQALVGGASVWFGGKALGGGQRARTAYKYHRLSGTLLLPLLLFTAHLGGGHSDWALGHSTAALRVVAFWVGLGLVLIGWAGRVRTSKLKVV